MKGLNFIANTIQKISREKQKIQRIKNDSEKRNRHVGYGIQSIVCSLFMIGTSALILLFGPMQSGANPLLALFLILLIILSSLLFPLIFAVYALIYSIIQMRLNRRVVGWGSLIIFILSLVPTIFLVISNLNRG
jgi:hypothetical protein